MTFFGILSLLLLAQCAFTVFVRSLTLWWSGRLFKLWNPTLARALAVNGVIIAMQILVVIIAIYAFIKVAPTQRETTFSSAVLGLALIVHPTVLLVTWVAIRLGVHVTWRRSLVATLVQQMPEWAGVPVFSLFLAILFRQLAGEAFIVPTGSMAPATQGAHCSVECSNCSFQYEVGMSERLFRPGLFPDVNVMCSSCGHCDVLGETTELRGGDQIMTDRSLRPKRWDVVVCSYGQEPGMQNIAHRLVGLPGENLKIHAGDVFINGERLRKRPDEADDMWLLLQDTTCVPRESVEGALAWQSDGDDSAWQKDSGVWRFAARQDAGGELSLSGPVRHQFSYNKKPDRWVGTDPPVVRDLRVDFQLDGLSESGAFDLLWEFDGWRALAEIEGSGEVHLRAERWMSDSRDWKSVSKSEGQLPEYFGSTPKLSFAFRDGWAYVASGGKVLAELAVGPSDLKSAEALGDGPTSGRLSIRGKKGSFALQRIALYRDVHYVNSRDLEHSPQPVTGNSRDYFMLGDNTTFAIDSRYMGQVPANSIVGVVRWRYWPPSRWREFR